MRLDELNSAVTIRLINRKVMQLAEPMTSIAISSGGALLIEFPNGSCGFTHRKCGKKLQQRTKTLKTKW